MQAPSDRQRGQSSSVVLAIQLLVQCKYALVLSLTLKYLLSKISDLQSVSRI